MINLGVPVINNEIYSGDTIESTKCRYKYTGPMDGMVMNRQYLTKSRCKAKKPNLKENERPLPCVLQA